MNRKKLNERMYEAIETKSALAIQMLLEQGVEFNSEICTEPTLKVLLIDAVYRGHANVVKSIADTVKNVNYKDNKELSPLHMAVVRRNEKIVRMLIDAGADVNMKGFQDMTPLQLSIMLENSKSARIFLDAIENKNSIQQS